MISIPQIRAARALLGWTQGDLAENAGLSEISVKNIERGVAAPKAATMAALITAIEKAGIEFTNGGRPGVRMKAKARPRRKPK
jgi:transcriptional regulator with XRE-family HTH domain